mgnify:CR=1 FL=1|jgi:hypothetical protein
MGYWLLLLRDWRLVKLLLLFSLLHEELFTALPIELLLLTSALFVFLFLLSLLFFLIGEFYILGSFLSLVHSFEYREILLNSELFRQEHIESCSLVDVTINEDKAIFAFAVIVAALLRCVKLTILVLGGVGVGLWANFRLVVISSDAAGPVQRQ